MNNFGFVLAVKCHCLYFVRLSTTKFKIWLFLAYCTSVRCLFNSGNCRQTETI